MNSTLNGRRIRQPLPQSPPVRGLFIKAFIVTILLVSSAPAWSQAGDDYLNALDRASGKKELSAPAAAAVDEQQGKLNETSDRYEMESNLAQNYPEEFALYRKFKVSEKNEVISAYKSTNGKADAVRMMKVINKIGLLTSGGGWDL
ncbi:MAG: hypothetical protein U9N50_12975 [Pseudomonadota bacterium]|nr:hypothetical protein [Pseudomonadota bacterium]